MGWLSIGTRAREALGAAMDRRKKHLRIKIRRIFARLQTLERLSTTKVGAGVRSQLWVES
jgi:hypothetical protein